MSATDNLKPEYAIDGLKGYQTGRFTHAHSHIINRAKGDTFFVGIDTQLILKLFESKIWLILSFFQEAIAVRIDIELLRWE